MKDDGAWKLAFIGGGAAAGLFVLPMMGASVTAGLALTAIDRVAPNLVDDLIVKLVRMIGERKSKDFTRASLNHHVLFALLKAQQDALIATRNKIIEESEKDKTDHPLPSLSPESRKALEEICSTLHTQLEGIKAKAEKKRERLDELGTSEEKLYDALRYDLPANENRSASEICSNITDVFDEWNRRFDSLPPAHHKRFMELYPIKVGSIFIEVLKDHSRESTAAFRAYQIFAYRNLLRQTEAIHGNQTGFQETLDSMRRDFARTACTVEYSEIEDALEQSAQTIVSQLEAQSAAILEAVSELSEQIQDHEGKSQNRHEIQLETIEEAKADIIDEIRTNTGAHSLSSAFTPRDFPTLGQALGFQIHGRQNRLQEVIAAIRETATTVQKVPIVVSGFGGQGKTHLIAHAVDSFFGNSEDGGLFPDGCFYHELRKPSSDDLPESKLFGKQLKDRELRSSQAGWLGFLESLVSKVFSDRALRENRDDFITMPEQDSDDFAVPTNALLSRLNRPGMLLILDSAELIRKVWTALSSYFANCTVVLGMRSPAPRFSARCFALEFLSEEAGERFILERGGIHPENEDFDFKPLVRAVQGYPLALAFFSASLQNSELLDYEQRELAEKLTENARRQDFSGLSSEDGSLSEQAVFQVLDMQKAFWPPDVVAILPLLALLPFAPFRRFWAICPFYKNTDLLTECFGEKISSTEALRRAFDRAVSLDLLLPAEFRTFFMGIQTDAENTDISASYAHCHSIFYAWLHQQLIRSDSQSLIDALVAINGAQCAKLIHEKKFGYTDPSELLPICRHLVALQESGITTSEADLYFTLGRIYQEQRQWAEALAAYQKALEWDEQSGQQHELGSTFAQLMLTYETMAEAAMEPEELWNFSARCALMAHQNFAEHAPHILPQWIHHAYRIARKLPSRVEAMGDFWELLDGIFAHNAGLREQLDGNEDGGSAS